MKNQFSNGQKIVIRNLQKKIPFALNLKSLKLAILKVLSLRKLNKFSRINIILVDNKQMKELNRRYLGRHYATDVITFDISYPKDKLLSDIVVSVDKALSNSKLYKTHPRYEVYLYVIHGILHLLGYNDRTAKQRRMMQREEQKIINQVLSHKAGHSSTSLSGFKARSLSLD